MNRNNLNRIWAKNSDIVRRNPGDEKYDQGWIAEIPTYQVLNYLQWKIDTTLLAIAERGIAEWGRDVTYGLGSVVWDESDKTIYVAIVGKPDINKNPSSNREHWSPSAIQVSRLEYDKIVALINGHIADVTSNPHKVTANGIGAYTKAEIDSIVDTYNALVSKHVQDKENPHGTTAKQIGAVPVVGGKYLGDVIFDKGIFFNDSGSVKVRVGGGEIYLDNDGWLLGLNKVGKPITGKPNAMSELITEKSFAGFKKTYQGNYSVPQKKFYMPLIRNLNILEGVGSSELVSAQEMYSDITGTLIMVNPQSGAVELNLSDVGNAVFGTTVTSTIAFDLRCGNNPYGSDVASFTLKHQGSWVLSITPNFTLRTYQYPETTPFARADLSKEKLNGGFRLVIRRGYSKSHNKSGLSIFVDGELVTFVEASLTQIKPGITALEARAVPENVRFTWRVSNFSVWNTSLSDEQISMI